MGASMHANFQQTVRRIQMFFSPKPSLSQGKYPSKFQLAWVRRFGGVRVQTNTQTHSLTDWCFDRDMSDSSLYPSLKAPVCQWVSEWVCLFVCLFPNSSKMANPSKLKFWGMSPWHEDGFRLKNIWICWTLSRKIACIVSMYTSNPSGQFYSLQYESSTYLQGW